MRLMQVELEDGGRAVVATEGESSWLVAGISTIYELARRAAAEKVPMEDLVRQAGRSGDADPASFLAAGQVLPPIDHPDPAHLMVSGTGLTHLGSASTRDAMHQKMAGTDEDNLTDTMKMFRLGVEGGKPADGQEGVQPEWFYKGDGTMVARPGGPLLSPSFADDAGEEPEVAGIYIIGDDGTPFRIGFALCNEFSDHVMERKNYLYLAHSKLRPCGLGPELRLGPLPAHVEGTCRIRRGDSYIFDKPFVTGEENMSHSIANLEAHHFKYPLFRRSGDVHVHTYGTATLSFADGVKTEDGDIFEIESPEFGLPLTNRLEVAPAEPVRVTPL